MRDRGATIPRCEQRFAARATLIGIALAFAIIFLFWGPR